MMIVAVSTMISAFVCGGFAAGQNAHYVISGLPTTKSIVREYQENKFVIFNIGAYYPTLDTLKVNPICEEGKKEE